MMADVHISPAFDKRKDFVLSELSELLTKNIYQKNPPLVSVWLSESKRSDWSFKLLKENATTHIQLNLTEFI